VLIVSQDANRSLLRLEWYSVNSAILQQRLNACLRGPFTRTVPYCDAGAVEMH